MARSCGFLPSLRYLTGPPQIVHLWHVSVEGKVVVIIIRSLLTTIIILSSSSSSSSCSSPSSVPRVW
jgi:hypothetical protein